ncbi:hypothetical protein Thiowin_01520 [Thiorhodovibrio winogradskyi]|uniref:Uncharacterized protein n=1 Tax=Thiorhodovibrio winogradskyi TaxID=77007 RepID=A0ABZ0SAG7_9GAMM|nr:hypothetical protein [Thiorhodovibrio winogradskyi]
MPNRTSPRAPIQDRIPHLRAHTSAVALYGGRGWRALRYGLNLMVFSRILTGRAGLTPIELPPAVVRKKGVQEAPPRPRVLDAGRDGVLRDFAAGFAEVHALLFANLQTAGLLSPHRSARPGPAFQGIYLWDSAFIAPIWQHLDSDVAAEVLASVLAVLAVREGRWRRRTSAPMWCYNSRP